MRSHLVTLALIAGCGSAATPARSPAPAAHAELSPALAPLAWWLGDWEAETGGGSEHWLAADGAIYGVALPPGAGWPRSIHRAR